SIGAYRFCCRGGFATECFADRKHFSNCLYMCASEYTNSLREQGVPVISTQRELSASGQFCILPAAQSNSGRLIFQSVAGGNKLWPAGQRKDKGHWRGHSVALVAIRVSPPYVLHCPVRAY